MLLHGKIDCVSIIGSQVCFFITRLIVSMPAMTMVGAAAVVVMGAVMSVAVVLDVTLVVVVVMDIVITSS